MDILIKKTVCHEFYCWSKINNEMVKYKKPNPTGKISQITYNDIHGFYL